MSFLKVRNPIPALGENQDLQTIDETEVRAVNESVCDVTMQTPIEIALAVDEEGFTTARKLYEWLELDNSNYSRWVKMNIIDNPFAEEGIEYSSCMKNINQAGAGRPSIDYRISASFAKKLAMMQRTERGEQARIYFLGCEQLAVKLAEERQKFLLERAKGISARLSLTDEISNSGENIRMKGHGYTTYTNLVYKTALGAGTRQLLAERGLTKKDSLRDHLSTEEIEAVSSVEQMIASMLKNGFRYDAIKKFCEEGCAAESAA